MTSTANGILFRRQIVSGALALLLPACSTWQVGTPTPAEFVTNRHPNLVRVTRTDGSKFDLLSPTALGDSLVGTIGGGLVREDTLHTVGVPLSDVQTVEVKKTAVGNTVGLVAVVAVAVGLLAMTIECNNKEDSINGTCY